ncbi:MerR family transcriptional regulator [Flavobacterium aciduliphilum]|uniref:MerR-like DNA binding protein n=1 Tax=Flavobacterium aciduliphilum TaxID=1101402 RepID=A0A328YTX5_9FLAO|nr:MerR family transcriptional regulator [Flavobacterium aciduliphilum]RAR75662.1 MerR-like DNA binding protein [Flavobacterium aciduliphilum]
MNNIKIEFSIKDLENLSGIKAHTIRIWEKRYHIFNPNRTETNVRFYSIEELCKLLNIAFLNNYGYKISRIASLSDKDLIATVKQVNSSITNLNYSINVLKVAMFNFDSVLFNQTHEELAKVKSFGEIFIDVYFPFLREIGMLWQTNSIKSIHEHFVSYLIYQKLISYIATINKEANYIDETKTFVLFLPENEIHEMSLMFVNSQLLEMGYKTIYLGSSVPFSDLVEMNKMFQEVIYVSYFTVAPHVDVLESYLFRFNDEIIAQSNSKLLISGAQTKQLASLYSGIYKFDTVASLIDFV